MADLFIGCNRGAIVTQPYRFTTGSSTGSTDVELRIDLSKSLTRQDVANILEGIEGYLLDGKANVSLGV